MYRNRSRGCLIETAFVGNGSSHEDLDEVDRIANHPVLRSKPHTNQGPAWETSLRKSRSESGAGLTGKRVQNPLSSSVIGTCHGGLGLSIWTGTQSIQGSPTNGNHVTQGGHVFGRSRGANPRGPVAQSRLSRSTTFNNCVASSPISGHSATSSWVYNPNTGMGAKSAPSTPPTWSASGLTDTFQPESRSFRGSRLLKSSEESVSQRSSSSSTQYVVHAVIENVRSSSKRDCFTPPPDLGAKPKDSLSETKTPPNTAPLPAKFNRLPQNLLRTQQRESDIQSTADSSSNNEVCMTSSGAKSPSSSLRFKLPLSLRARIKLDREDSSSAESSPQKQMPLASSTGQSRLVKRGMEASTRPNLLVMAPKPIQDLAIKQSSKSKFFSSGESSCSSAMSSLESLRSTTSDGVQSLMSSESGAVSSMSSQSSDNFPSKPSLDLGYSRHPKLVTGGVSSKFQVLSPISDKSQEQYSEVCDPGSNKTPKVSPSSTLTPSSIEANTVIDNESCRMTSENLNNNVLNDNDASASSKNTNDNELRIQQALDVPWDMPKLKRRLQGQGSNKNLNNLVQHRRTLELQGSDSGISLDSQDLKDMKELLNVPWDMPKLRKKTQQSNFLSSRPQSMNMEPPSRNMSIVSNSQSSSCQSSNENMVLPQPVPPPPPGFEDSGDEFYLANNQFRGTPERKARPKMTLSFGIDPSLKTLMFATNSPFGLNECEDVDPNLPLDRQEWYHGTISKSEAEERLRALAEGNYLVRTLDSSRQEYALSLKSARGYMHMKIRRDTQTREFQLSDFHKRFMSVPQMVHHYTRNRLPIKGAEHMCLKHPVREQML